MWIWRLPPSIFDVTRLLAPSGDVVEAISIRETSLWVACLLPATMAALIAGLRSRNATGWWLSVLALGFTTNVVGSVYPRFALARNPSALPGGELVLWLAQWCTAPAQTALVFMLLLFPSGRVASSRWRLVLWMASLGVAFYAIDHAITPGPIETTPFSLPSNPFAIKAIPSILGRGSAVFLVYLPSILLAVVGLVNRLRRARGTERQQLKWFAFGAGWFPWWLWHLYSSHSVTRLTHRGHETLSQSLPTHDDSGFCNTVCSTSTLPLTARWCMAPSPLCWPEHLPR